MVKKAGTVSLNPFVHTLKGAKNILLTNISTVFIVSLFSTAALTGIGYALSVWVLPDFVLSTSRGPSFEGTLTFLLALSVFSTLFTSYVALATSHPILNGVQKRKVTATSSLKFALKRLPLALAVDLLLFLAVAGAFGIVALARINAPGLGIVLFFILLLAMVVAMFHLIFVPLVLVDKKNPGIGGTIRQSSALFSHAPGAVIWWVVTMIAALVLISVATGNISRNTTTLDQNTRIETLEDLERYLNQFEKAQSGNTLITSGTATTASILIQSLTSAAVAIIGLAGLANIYTEAQQLGGSKKRPAQRKNTWHVTYTS